MQIAELASKLEALGLNDKEARVYVATLFLGPSPVQKIAEQAEINRATAYVILEQLAGYGLVSQSTEGKKTVFVAEGPEAIERWLDAQERQIRLKREELRSIADELVASERTDTEAPIVRFYKGEQGNAAASAYERRKASPKETIYAMSNVDELLKFNPSILEQNPRSRAKKRLKSHLLYSFSQGELDDSGAGGRVSRKIEGPVRADIALYEKTASFTTYQGKNSIGVLIESKPIVSALRQLFEQAWENTSARIDKT